MRIGELSTAASTAVETIRYYEREGLLPAPRRTKGNYRMYDKPHLERLQFIRYCRGLDMSLDEVRVLLRVKDAPAENCDDVNALLDEHIAHVAKRILELRRLEHKLRTLRQHCTASRPADTCGILSGMAEASRHTTAHGREVHRLKSVHRN